MERIMPRNSIQQLLEEFRTDVIYGLRMLIAAPSFAFTVIISLALAISANTAVFSVLEMLLLRLLPIQSPEQLVQISRTGGGALSYPMYNVIRDQNKVFSQTLLVATGRSATDLQMSNGTSAEVHFSIVSPDFFNTLGLAPEIGHSLAEKDLAASNSLVISYSLWQRVFERRNVVGTPIRFAGKTYVIIGVARRGFTGLEPGQPVDAWVPATFIDRESLNNRVAMMFSVIGRLKPGLSMDQANANMQVLARQWSDDWKFETPTQLEVASASTGLAEARRRFRNPLIVLMALVSVLLLICSANVASLLLNRAIARQSEFATRMAIGASFSRLARQLATEGLTIAVIGGAAGLSITGPATAATLRFLSTTFTDIQMKFSVNASVLAFSLVILCVITIFCGLVPILGSLGTRRHPRRGIQPSFGPGNPRPLLSRSIVVLQVAFSCVLLVIAILFARSLHDLITLDPGFVPENLSLLHVQTSPPGPDDDSPSIITLSRALRDLTLVPGVRSVAYSSEGFFTGNRWTESITVPDRPLPKGADHESTLLLSSPEFLQTMKMGLLAGRDFTEYDSKPAPRVAIVTESMAKYYFRTSAVLGKAFQIENPHFARPVTIVGVLKDSKYASLKEPAPKLVLLPAAQHPDLLNRATFAVRTAGSPAGTLLSLERTMRNEGAPLQFNGSAIQEALIEATISQDRMLAALAGIFAVAALSLACVGLYGMTTYEVSRRTVSISMRIALGAQGTQIIRTVLKETMIVLTIGTVLGVAVATASARLVQSLLFNVRGESITTISGAAVLIILIGLCAAYVPARKAARLDPNRWLRHQ